MSNDAKLGLVLGVAIVVVIGLVFFRTDPVIAKMPADKGRATTALSSDAREGYAPKSGHANP